MVPHLTTQRPSRISSPEKSMLEGKSSQKGSLMLTAGMFRGAATNDDFQYWFIYGVFVDYTVKRQMRTGKNKFPKPKRESSNV